MKKSIHIGFFSAVLLAAALFSGCDHASGGKGGGGTTGGGAEATVTVTNAEGLQSALTSSAVKTINIARSFDSNVSAIVKTNKIVKIPKNYRIVIDALQANADITIAPGDSGTVKAAVSQSETGILEIKKTFIVSSTKTFTVKTETALVFSATVAKSTTKIDGSLIVEAQNGVSHSGGPLVLDGLGTVKIAGVTNTSKTIETGSIAGAQDLPSSNTSKPETVDVNSSGTTGGGGATGGGGTTGGGGATGGGGTGGDDPLTEEDNTDSDKQATKTPTSWTSYTITEMQNLVTLNSVAYGKGIGFVIGSGTDYAYPVFAVSTTANSNSWTVKEVTANISGFDSFVGKVRRLNNKFIATRGSGPDYAIISVDGINWQSVYIGFGTKGFAYGEGVSLVAGQKGQAAYSTDGMLTWTKKTHTDTGFSNNGSNGYLNGAAYGNGRFVVGGGQGRTAISTDGGNTWTHCQETGVTSPKVIFDSGFIDSMIFFKGKFIAMGGMDGAEAKSAYSTDGLNWTQGGNPGLKTSNDTSPMMVQGAGYIVAVDLQGKAAYSTDGINWTSCGNTGFPDYNGIKDVAYGNGRFVMVGAGGRVSYCDVL
jgi:hypothetical protein